MELCEVKGLGDKRISALNDAGIFSCKDLLDYFPYKYYDFTLSTAFSNMPNSVQLVEAVCVAEPKCVFVRGLSYCIAEFKDQLGGGKFKAVWYNQPYMKNNLEVDAGYFLQGKTNSKKQLVVQFYTAKEKVEKKIISCYKSVEGGIGNSVIKKSLLQIFDNIQNIDCGSLLKENSQADIIDAYKKIHFPENIAEIEKAKSILAIQKLMLFVALEDLVKSQKFDKNRVYKRVNQSDFEALLPFKLTQDQSSVISDIYSDMDSTGKMNRLVLGDVGSGKTMVAFASIYKAMLSGYQSVFLCPTEVLAKQHYENAIKIFGDKVTLLHSGLKKQEQKYVLESIESGESKVIVATHSILSDSIHFNNLALVITDEQHRFGVGQRAKLGHIYNDIDELVMSATPIPRSLALVLFGGLEVSKISARPSGESRVETKIVSSKRVDDMWRYISGQLSDGTHKCFAIVPRIEGEEGLASTKQVSNYLVKEKYFTKEELSCISGNMKSEKINEEFSRFVSPVGKVMVATTVVEVGVDVKPANIMVIYNADRFGLATLHQLRGRVGRDGSEGYVFCVVDELNELSMDRLKIFKDNNDGLKIAEEDLKLRGSGTLYGTNQHGVNELFAGIDFSVERYDEAKKIWADLSESQKDNLRQTAQEKFGELYKQIVLN